MGLELTNRCFIIGEVGTCHANPDPSERFYRAMDYVHIASTTGIDAIKFQMFDDPNPETMFCWIEGDKDRAYRWSQSRLSIDQWWKVKCEAEQCGLVFLSSPFEHETVKWQTELDVCATKVASRAAAYLDAYKNAPKPLLVSNGMYEVESADDRIILQCEANYPSHTRWKQREHGFSDHSGNPYRAIDAIARGCKLLEVHFYVNPVHAGPDLPASLTLDQLRMVCEARDTLHDSL